MQVGTDVVARHTAALPRHEQHDGAADEAGQVLRAQAEESAAKGGVLHAHSVRELEMGQLYDGCSTSPAGMGGRGGLEAAGRDGHR